MFRASTEKLDHFARFISLLTGELDVRVCTAHAPEAGAVVIPPLDDLDDQAIDVLYGLCLREAGYISRSRKTVAAVTKLSTELQLKAAMLVEAARIEKFLIRRFAGGAEILDEHYTKQVRDPRFTQIILGVDPQHATSEEVFLYALKWTMLGRPHWGWEELFPADLWQEAVAYLGQEQMDTTLSLPWRKFEDSVDLGVQALQQWLEAHQRSDDSALRKKPQEQKVWEQALHEVSTTLTDMASSLQHKLDQKKEKLDALQQSMEEERQRIAPQADPLRERVSALKEEVKANSRFEHQLSAHSRLRNHQDKLSSKMDQKKERVQSLSEKEQTLAQGPSDEKNQARLDALEARRQEIESKSQDKITGLQKKFSEWQSKELDCQDQLNTSGLTDAQKERLQQRLDAINSKMDDITSKMEAAQQQADDQMAQLDAKSQAIETRSEKAAQRQLQRMEDLQQRTQQVQSEVDQMQKEHDQLSEQLKKIEREVASQLKGDDPQAALERMLESSAQYNAGRKQLAEMEQKLDDLKDKHRAARHELTQQAQKEQWKMTQAMQRLESDLAAAGMPINLTEQMVEMEGWDAANNAQRDFDDKASHSLQMSVVNGCGGGRGNRDMMVQLQDLTGAIEDLDPNLIFADVARLSPLSGFSESGVRADDSGNPHLQAPKQASMTKMGVAKHTVWSRQFDRIQASPNRSPKLVAGLRRSYAKEIAEVKNIFIKNMKPSFKNRFVGGREEGDLDARNIWKLAANSGEDFFETIHKRPHTKAAATILVDLSGSCASWATAEGSADEQIQALALMLSEGLSAVNIPHEILGYCAPLDERLSEMSIPATYNRKACRLETVVAKSFKDKDLSGLAGLSIQQADNSDGESVRVALDRLCKQNGASKMMFVISDGKPFMQDADCAILDDDLRLALLEAAQRKVVVSCLGLSANHAVLGDSYLSAPSAHQLPEVLKAVFKKDASS